MKKALKTCVFKAFLGFILSILTNKFVDNIIHIRHLLIA
jgi:hypothetical protein